jgi:hypothetical protein
MIAVEAIWKPRRSVFLTRGSRESAQENNFMVHELLFALVFLAMIAAPAIMTIPSDRDERDPL